MNVKHPFSGRRVGRLRRAFTLVEILTAVAITTLIVVALVSMFTTSTKVLQAANRQTDIWEAARSAFGLIESDISEVASGGSLQRVNLYANTPGGVSSSFVIPNFGTIDCRLQEIYVLSREGENWRGVVYRVERSDLNQGVGTLYRFQTNVTAFNSVLGSPLIIDANINANAHPLNELNPFNDPSVDPAFNPFKKMVDGVVHLRLVPFAPDGRSFTNSGTLANPPVDHRVGDDWMEFRENALPASVDLEMFVLDPDRIEEFRAQSGNIAKRNYLEKHFANIQIFRTRIPIRKDAYASR